MEMSRIQTLKKPILNRRLLNDLIIWKNRIHRKPLILKGARQVGKTHLLKFFGENYYSDFAYFNFEEDPALSELFSSQLSAENMIQALSIYRGKKIVERETLLVLDEIQACPAALTSLKYFEEQVPELHLIAAGSLLGIQLSQTHSFPVGKVSFLQLFPLTFYEFLDALGKVELQKMLEELKIFNSFPEIIHAELQKFFKIYLFIGGMPEAVLTYLQEEDFTSVRRVQLEIIQSYLLDFSKHTQKTEVIKITRIWESIPFHLGKENKKFIFSAISKSARGREYEIALQWLVDAGLIIKTYLVEAPQIPLQSYQSQDAFKVYLLDVGLLGAMMRIQANTIILGNELFTHAKGALVESFVAQELSFYFQDPLRYWASQASAEVDFLLTFLFKESESIFPLEVKSGESTKTKSLIQYSKKYSPPYLFRVNLLNLKKAKQLVNVPLYMLGSLKNIFKILENQI